jgi:hypothetical protein
MNLLTLILAPFALLILIVASSALLKSPHRAAALLLAVYVADTLWVGLPAIPLGLHIYAQDALFVFLIIAASLRYVLGMAHIERSRLAVLTLFLLVLFSLGRGIVDYGPTQAGVECRGFFWLFAGIVYFSSFQYSEKRLAEMIRLWQKAACALIAIAIFRWIATGLHMSVAASWAEPDAPAMRVLDAANAMFLCVAFFFSMALKASRKGSRWQQNLYYVIGPALILLQHRTVWVVTALGMAWMFRSHARIMRKSLIAFGVTAGAGAALVVSVFGLDRVIDSLQQSATSSGSLIWRVAGWYQLVFLRAADAWHLLFGDPFGAGFERVIATVQIDVTPHNFYIETYLRLGIVGLCVLLWFLGSQLRACRKLTLHVTPSSAYVNPRIWRLFLLFQMIFSLTYNPGYEQCMMFGMIVGISALSSTTAELANGRMLSKPMLPEPS